MNIPPELLQYLIPLASAIIGYLLRHYHIAIPGLPQSPNPVPIVAPTPSTLAEILNLLKAFQNPGSAPTPTTTLAVSTPTHDVKVDQAGTVVTAK